MAAEYHGDDKQLSPGAVLKEARERAGISEREVAESLKLIPDEVRALEGDDYGRHSNPLFYKAHLKAYARLLQLDSQKLIEMYRASYMPVDEEPLSSMTAAPPIQRPVRGHSFRYWGLAVVVVVSAVLWQTQAPQLQQPLPETAVVVDSNDQNSLRSLDGADSVDLDSGLELDGFADTAQPSLVIDLPASKIREEGAAALSGSPSADQLKFSFSEDCWVEVKDGQGEVIFANLKRASETLELSGMGPFKVLLGYAHGVSLDYNGQPVEINVKNRNNSARLVVGNLPVR